LHRFHGKVTKAVDDRLYTDEELHLLIEHSDIRVRTIILTLLSSEMRVEALTELKFGDILYLEDIKSIKYLFIHKILLIAIQHFVPRNVLMLSNYI